MTTIRKMVSYASGAAVIGLAAGFGVASTPAHADSCGVTSTLDTLLGGSGITCDKTYTFSNYNGTASGPNATPVPASAISVTPSVTVVPGGFLANLQINTGNWAIGAGSAQDTAFTETVTAPAGLYITAVNSSGVFSTDGGLITFSEAVFNHEGGTLLTTLTNNSPGEVSLGGNYTSLYILKDLNLNTTFGGTFAVASNYNESFLQVVPEIDAASGTGAIGLLLGAMALAGERRRRRAA